MSKANRRKRQFIVLTEKLTDSQQATFRTIGEKMKKSILALVLGIMALSTGCASTNPIIESTLADGTVIRAQLINTQE